MRCDKCPRARFQTLQQYKQHKLECHYHCIDCNKSFINHLEAEFHAGNVHCDEHGIYSCRECPFKTFDYDYFTDHMKSNHSKFTEILVKAEQNEEEFSENTETSKSLEMEIDPLASVTDNTSNSNSIENDLAQIIVKIEPYCNVESNIFFYQLTRFLLRLRQIHPVGMMKFLFPRDRPLLYQHPYKFHNNFHQ